MLRGLSGVPKKVEKPTGAEERQGDGPIVYGGGQGQGGARAPSAPAPTTLPAHDVSKISPETRGEETAAMGAQGAAEQKDIQAQRDVEEQEGKEYEREAADFAKQEHEAQAAEGRRQAVLNDWGTYIANAERDASSGKIDPGHFWKTRTEAQKAMGIIAEILHGFVRPGDPNGPIAQGAQQQMEADRLNLENARHGVEQKRNIYADLLKKFGDQRVAEEGARAMHGMQLALAAKSAAVTARSPIWEAKADAAIADQRKRLADFDAASRQFVQAQVVGGAGAGGISPAQQGNVFKDPFTGQDFIARNPESRKKLADSATKSAEVQRLANQYAGQLKQLSASDIAAAKVGYTTEAMARARTTHLELQSQVRQARDEGVWKKAEVEMLEQQLTPPDHFTGQPEVQARAIASSAARAHATAMRVEDALPVQTGFKYDAQGHLVPTAGYTGQNYAAPPQASQFRPPGGR
jgi:hypothetical protein